MIPGGWQMFENIPQKYMEVYNKIKPNLKNGEYTPLAVASCQVGSETVCFICRTINQSQKEYFSKVMVHIGIGEEPKFESAREIFL
ncbi:MAG: hypothetical protein RSE07_00155 [Oscillospiraceae bacterium]